MSPWAAIDLEGNLDVAASPEGVRVVSVGVVPREHKSEHKSILSSPNGHNLDTHRNFSESGPDINRAYSEHIMPSVALVDAHTADIKPLLDALEDVEQLYVHGKEFDLLTLTVNFGFEPKGQILDTLNASRCACPGALIETGSGEFDRVEHGLAVALERELGIELVSDVKNKFQRPEAWLGKKTDEIVPELTEEHAAYAVADVYHLKALHDRLLERMDELGQRTIYETLEVPIQRVVLKMMARGVPVDLGGGTWRSHTLSKKFHCMRHGYGSSRLSLLMSRGGRLLTRTRAQRWRGTRSRSCAPTVLRWRMPRRRPLSATSIRMAMTSSSVRLWSAVFCGVSLLARRSFYRGCPQGTYPFEACLLRY
jgi:hypothetical protein